MYQYTNPKMQEVAKLCEKGFWPICKNERGEYAIFSPVINGIDCLRKTDWVNSIKRAKEIIGATFHDNTHIQPTEIVDFYHPPTPKFEIGDKVRVREDLADLQIEKGEDYAEWVATAGKIGTISRFGAGSFADIDISNNHFRYTLDLLEPFIEMTVAEIEEKLGVKNLKIFK